MAKSDSFSMICWVFLLLPQIAVSGSVVKYLPGFDGPLPFELETGYVGVGESDDVQLFYYFIKSERNPEEDPLMVWLTGGPGCSSFTGLVLEIGPLKFKDVEYSGGIPPMESVPYSWTKDASIIFLDTPVGTGFSYRETSSASPPSDLTQVEQIYEFLRKWLMDHPEFLSNQFYIGGDSYSGMIIPAIALQIATGNEQGLEPLINLQGYVEGNPVTDTSFDENSVVPFAHGMALISDELYKSLQRSCKGEYQKVDPSNPECLRNIQAFLECTSKIYGGHILREKCGLASPKPFYVKFHEERFSEASLVLGRSVPEPSCFDFGYVMSEFWANNESVREALHIRKGSITDWNRCTYRMPYSFDIHSGIPYHLSIGAKGFRSLVYSGDHDMTIPYVGTQAWIRALNFSIVDDWRPWMIDGHVAGYARTYSNKMTFATVKGGGHTAEYKRPPYHEMFKRWINDEPL